jgi:chaperonin GroEL
MTKIYSNIVPEDKVREVQRETLDIISKALCQSFGPKGSSTAFVKDIDPKSNNISIEHTKDGHNIVKNIKFLNPIERSVQDLLTDLTRYVVKEVGDGTTSAIILCKTVFDCLCDANVIIENSPADTLSRINKIINEVSSRIIEKKRECTLDDIYDIALISTNNNEEISGTLKVLYEHYGMDVFIDVGISTVTDNIVKEYDGMTLDTGFTDVCFINDKDNACSKIRNPKIYCFADPIDTPEMLSMVQTIIDNNILRAYQPRSVYEPVPTVIFCKKISSDTSSYFSKIVTLMNTYENIPLLIVSDIHQDYLYEDITKMVGAKVIKKYLNFELQQKDQEAGLAPTLETICDFCGTADLVQSDSLKTKIIRPSKMFNEDGTYSDEYNAMVSYLEGQVEKCKNEDAGIEAISRAKRRLNCFKGNMVDFLIGGLTISDRNNLKASVEDAVLNCRSAAVNGVGYGANYMAFSVLNEMKNEAEYSGDAVVDILYDAYERLLKTLYGKSYPENEVDEIIRSCINMGCPLNIRTNSYDGKVLSSIRSDVIILETINKILSLMFTTNQYLVQHPANNVYVTD